MKFTAEVETESHKAAAHSNTAAPGGRHGKCVKRRKFNRVAHHKKFKLLNLHVRAFKISRA